MQHVAKNRLKCVMRLEVWTKKHKGKGGKCNTQQKNQVLHIRTLDTKNTKQRGAGCNTQQKNKQRYALEVWTQKKTKQRGQVQHTIEKKKFIVCWEVWTQKTQWKGGWCSTQQKKTRCTFGAFGDKTHRGKGGRWNMQQKKHYAFGAMDTKNKEEGG